MVAVEPATSASFRVVCMATVWSRIFDYPDATGALIIAAKTAVVYVFLILGLRVLGKRELGQMNLYDLVMIIVLGNAVQNAMINGDNTLVGGIVAATVLLVMNRGFNALVLKSRTVERVMVGEPTVIVHDGEPVPGVMKRQGVTKEQLDAGLREHGIDELSKVHLCVLEVDGSLSVVSTEGGIYRSKRHYRGLRLP
jgi:uncharacterized membrane protein YcaP (DUF421 family)